MAQESALIIEGWFDEDLIDVGSSVSIRTVTPSGGMTLSGAAAKARVKVESVSGGMALSGSAAFSKGKSVSPQGGITFSGTASSSRAKVMPPSGGLVLSGAATYSSVGTQTYSYSASGGLVLSGTAARLVVRAISATGGIALSGTSSKSSGRAVPISGGIVLSGLSGYLRTKVIVPAGGPVFSGASGYSSSAGNISYSYSASGGIALSGAATYSKLRSVGLPIGGLSLSGVSTFQSHVSTATWTSTGGFVFTGTSPVSFFNSSAAQISKEVLGDLFMNHTFIAIGAPVTLSASVASANGTLPGGGGTSIRVENSTTSVAFVKWGQGAQTATTADAVVLPGTGRSFQINGTVVDNVAVILASGTGTVYVQRGHGV